MKKQFFFAWAVLCLSAGSAKAQSWKPGYTHIPTRWTQQVSPANVHKEYPRPQMVRKNWKNLNGLWEYAIVPKDAAPPSQYNGKILVPYPVESALSGVKRSLQPTEELWYKTRIQQPVAKPGERVLLHFGAVDWQATVFVNGKKIGVHEGGYQNFTFDITDALKPGSNEINVKVFDPTDKGFQPIGKQTLTPSNIYYTPTSGIWQTVWLETVPQTHIDKIKTVPDIDNENLYVTVNASASARVELIATSTGKPIGRASGNVGETIALPVKNAKLWSPESPNLYDLSVRLIDENGKQLDAAQSYFGMRKIAVGKDEKGVERLLLNNKYVYQLGVLDQGFWPDGLYTAPTDEALAYDIKAIKAMGFNTIRKHIKIEPARWYYHADKLGMIVWQDMVQPSYTLSDDAKAAFEKEMVENIDQLGNYPCITTWVLFNERWGAYDQKRLSAQIGKLDPSRILNAHSGEVLYVNEESRHVADELPKYEGSVMTDIHSYPNPMLPEKQPGKAMVLGEFGGVGVSVPYHQHNDLQAWGYVQVKPKELEGKYGMMISQLKSLEAKGLSASIYTQPFDVEDEENGLLTYDREVIKIPLEKIRQMNSALTPNTKIDYAVTSLAKNIDVSNTDERFAEMQKHMNTRKKDSAFLRRLTLMAMRQKDQPALTRITAAYVNSLKNLYTKTNLEFLQRITRTSADTGFVIFSKNASMVNAVLGGFEAQRKVMDVISGEEISPYTKDKNAVVDWDAIEKKAVAKNEELGREVVYGYRMMYHLDRKELPEFTKYYQLYFSRAIGRSIFHVNNVSWELFKKSDDTAALNLAVKAMKFDLENYTGHNPNMIDTYANLLYKTGKKDDAIYWQTQAISKSTIKEQKERLMDVLEKMKKGEPTWIGVED